MVSREPAKNFYGGCRGMKCPYSLLRTSKWKYATDASTVDDDEVRSISH